MDNSIRTRKQGNIGGNYMLDDDILKLLEVTHTKTNTEFVVTEF